MHCSHGCTITCSACMGCPGVRLGVDRRSGLEMIHPCEVLIVAVEYTRILVWDITLSFSQLPGERVSWGMGFVGSWPALLKICN